MAQFGAVFRLSLLLLIAATRMLFWRAIPLRNSNAESANARLRGTIRREEDDVAAATKYIELTGRYLAVAIQNPDRSMLATLSQLSASVAPHDHEQGSDLLAAHLSVSSGGVVLPLIVASASRKRISAISRSWCTPLLPGALPGACLSA